MSGAVRQRTVRLSAWPASWSVNSSDILQPVISVQRNIMFLDFSLPVRNTDMFVVCRSYKLDSGWTFNYYQAVVLSSLRHIQDLALQVSLFLVTFSLMTNRHSGSRNC